jgi:hypothetical protein
MASAHPPSRAATDEATLKELNLAYLAAFMESDVRWYEQHLAPDFICRSSSGATLDKATFLRRTAEGPDLIEFQLHKVRVRLEGDSASIDGTASYVQKDGVAGTCRYTDVYRWAGDQWLVMSASVKRIPRLS